VAPEGCTLVGRDQLIQATGPQGRFIPAHHCAQGGVDPVNAAIQADDGHGDIGSVEK
jgi:hypothetical protein